MSEKIDPREVLAYLNELGYTNITAQQLKEFIKGMNICCIQSNTQSIIFYTIILDLKKVIKYDSRYGGMREVVTEDQSYFGEESDYCDCPESDKKDKRNTSASSDKENQPDDLQPVNKTQQQQKSIKDNTQNIQRDKHIAVHIYDNKNRKNLNHDHCVHVNPPGTRSSQYNEENVKLVCNICSVTTESTIKSVPPNSSRELTHSRTSKRSNEKKYKAACK